MSERLYDILFPVNRWLHLVCMTLIVGGTLFYELVLPLAMDEQKPQEKLYVFARARLIFRWVVWLSVVGLLASGAISLNRTWQTVETTLGPAPARYVLTWALGHVVLGILALVLALVLTIGPRPLDNPVRWMRVNLVILLVTIFVGSATRHFQIALHERGVTSDEPEPPIHMPATTRGTP